LVTSQKVGVTFEWAASRQGNLFYRLVSLYSKKIPLTACANRKKRATSSLG
jgi:hypothetical protein